MKTSTLLSTLAAAALLSSFGTANATNIPSPCASGEVGAGSNCMYLTTTGASYDSGTGNRSASTGLSFSLDVWMDFNQIAVQGGGFDVAFDTMNVTSMNWSWAPFNSGDGFDGFFNTLDGAQGASGFEGIQFDDFRGNGNGWGGSTGNLNGFQLVGTLDVVLSGAASLLINIAQPYGMSQAPNCFAPGAASGQPSACVATDFYSLQVNAAPVPVPAAVWLMLTGIGSMLGFSRRKAS